MSVHVLHVTGQRSRTIEPKTGLLHWLATSAQVAHRPQKAGQKACTCGCQLQYWESCEHGGMVSALPQSASTIVVPRMRKPVYDPGTSMHVLALGGRSS